MTSVPSALILQALVEGSRYTTDIIEVTGLPGATVYSTLRAMESEGLLTSEWDNIKQAHAELRPALRHYAISSLGRAALADPATRKISKATA